jgi:hypothetical protein
MTSLEGILEHREMLIARINRLMVLVMHYLEINLTCCDATGLHAELLTE